ncbi:MAG: glycoside hydrolase family 127 protein [Clostridia bacterium]|nr:glycoside hydrolase family 127 protein [Clostridia bacterium]
MKNISYENVTITSGFLFDKQELNRNTTIGAVYDQFFETGRIDAFRFEWKEGDEKKPHYFWDSDVAKWIEGAAYIIQKHPTPELLEKIEWLVERIKEHQGEDGYFNIFYTVCEPDGRWTNRDRHELYCAGHLMEAAVAYAQVTGKTDFLDCMEKYADYIQRVFVEEKSAAFVTPGHEEIELALIRMYEYTEKKKFLDLAAFFINARGVVEEPMMDEYRQTHKPVREQTAAEGHAVRALYLYTSMAMLAAKTGDEALACACRTLWKDITRRKMYVTGACGSTPIGEAFTAPFDLPNEGAYAETCASIALMFFGRAMLALENRAEYADVIERALYNGVLSGLSLSGDEFFYTNPLAICKSEYFENCWGKRKLPRTQRLKVFKCSCCPPNLNRLLPTLGGYLYGIEGERLYVNQFASSGVCDGEISCAVKTDYPRSGEVRISARGAKELAVRVPSWCDKITCNVSYRIENGYAIIQEPKSEVVFWFHMAPKAVRSDPRVVRNMGRICFMRGPIVYCAEAVDNGEDLHTVSVSADAEITVVKNQAFGLPCLKLPCRKRLPDDLLYASGTPNFAETELTLIPYHCFANRGESEMLVWLAEEI